MDGVRGFAAVAAQVTGVDRALQLIADSDLLIVGGTSLTVYPAAGFITYRGGKLAVINKTPTAADAQADLCIHGSVGDALAAAWE